MGYRNPKDSRERKIEELAAELEATREAHRSETARLRAELTAARWRLEQLTDKGEAGILVGQPSSAEELAVLVHSSAPCPSCGQTLSCPVEQMGRRHWNAWIALLTDADPSIVGLVRCTGCGTYYHRKEGRSYDREKSRAELAALLRVFLVVAVVAAGCILYAIWRSAAP